MVGCSVNIVLERMWKDAVWAEFEVLLWHLPERSEEKKTNPSQDNWPQVFNSGLPI
jgi:hypothetical protein